LLSFLTQLTVLQANALKVALKKKNLNANIYVGMRYWYPFTEEAIDQIKKDKITKLVVLPLYPQYSISTSGSSIRVLQNIVKEDSYFAGLPISIIESWYQRDGYVKSMADLIEKELSIFSNPEEV
jgi:ferrochelatase